MVIWRSSFLFILLVMFFVGCSYRPIDRSEALLVADKEVSAYADENNISEELFSLDRLMYVDQAGVWQANYLNEKLGLELVILIDKFKNAELYVDKK